MHTVSHTHIQYAHIDKRVWHGHKGSMRRKEAASFLRAVGLNREERNDQYCQLDSISRLLVYLYTQPADPFFCVHSLKSEV